MQSTQYRCLDLHIWQKWFWTSKSSTFDQWEWIELWQPWATTKTNQTWPWLSQIRTTNPGFNGCTVRITRPQGLPDKAETSIKRKGHISLFPSQLLQQTPRRKKKHPHSESKPHPQAVAIANYACFITLMNWHCEIPALSKSQFLDQVQPHTLE